MILIREVYKTRWYTLVACNFNLREQKITNPGIGSEIWTSGNLNRLNSVYGGADPNAGSWPKMLIIPFPPQMLLNPFSPSNSLYFAYFNFITFIDPVNPSINKYPAISNVEMK